MAYMTAQSLGFNASVVTGVVMEFLGMLAEVYHRVGRLWVH